MALTAAQKAKLNSMCPAAYDSQIGTVIDGKADIVSTASVPPTANAGNVGKFFFDTTTPDLYFCSDASTMTKLT